jgi:soluble lytic murein transglycosylase-like protein
MTTTHRIIKTLLLIGTLACLAWLMATPPADATDGACGIPQAKRAALKAHKALVKAKAADKEARHVLSATRYYSNHNYDDFCGRHIEDPAKVGRWVSLARKAGWPWSAMDTLMHVIARESSGYPGVPNSEGSGAAGLLQLMPGWYNGSYYDFPDFNPYDAYLNLYYGRKGWEESGWTPWAI